MLGWLSERVKYFKSPENSKRTKLLQIQALRVEQVKESCIGLTQENSIENSVQDGLPYIQIPNGLYEPFLTYPKWPYVYLKVNMYFTYYIISSF